MTTRFATTLLDLAAWIAPAHRREWIEGLRAEADLTPHPSGWAWGALSTAIRERLIDTVVSGLALRLVSGGFVVGCAATGAAFIIMRIPTIIGHNDKHLVWLAGITAIIAVMTSGGLAIVFSAGRPWVDRYGRALFALNALYVGWSQIELFLTSQRLHHFRHLGQAGMVAGPLLVAAAIALVFRWPRLFFPSALGATCLLIWGWGGQWGAALPALIAVCAGGLLTGRRTARTA